MKKKILFVIESLACAGAEKSLITLLSLLDYNKYNVSLQLFNYGSELEVFIPKQVNVLDDIPLGKFNNLQLKTAILTSIKESKFRLLEARIKFSSRIRIGKFSNPQKARIFWECSNNVIEKSKEKYDIAIAYSQGIPTFYVAEKVNAKVKYSWINVSYKLKEEDRKFQQKYYEKFNKIIAVSESSKNIFIETFPNSKEKLEVIYDINDYKFINKMAQMGNCYKDNYEGLKILTIGRLANQKGYDIALKACKILKEKNIDFKWYCLGKGPLEEDINEYIKKNKLEENFKLLGITSNPYPYIKNCDIYVQTSRFEGFGLAIAEARMLNKPVVTTKFDAVYNQMINEKNGLVVEMDAESVAKGIKRLINDRNLRENIIQYLNTEKKGNTEELYKFYNIIEGKIV